MLILTFLYLLGLPFAREVFLYYFRGLSPDALFFYLLEVQIRSSSLKFKNFISISYPPKPSLKEGPKGPGPLDTRKLGESLQLARKEARFGGEPALLGLPAVIPQGLVKRRGSP